MQMNHLEVFINAHREIVVRQLHPNLDAFIFITPDQAEIVADEIKKLAKQLKEEQNNGK